MICLQFVVALMLNVIIIKKAHVLQYKCKEFVCGCKSLHNKPCSELVDLHPIIDHHGHVLELSLMMN